jgi:hypothetical protein
MLQREQTNSRYTEIFRTATDEAARIGVSQDFDTDVPFSFGDHHDSASTAW